MEDFDRDIEEVDRHHGISGGVDNGGTEVPLVHIEIKLKNGSWEDVRWSQGNKFQKTGGGLNSSDIAIGRDGREVKVWLFPHMLSELRHLDFSCRFVHHLDEDIFG